MATQKVVTNRIVHTPLDWNLQAQQRIRPVWHVVAMSLGVAPSKETVAEAKGDKAFFDAFEERKKLLCMKFSSEPLVGHVTYFPRHGYNVSKSGAANRMADVVSCIEILEPMYSGKLPLEFVALKEPLSKLPLPKQNSPFTGVVVVPSPAMAPVLEAKPKKSQASRAASLEHHNLHVLLFSMACAGYKYSERMTPSEKQAIAETIADDVPALLKGRYGLSPASILKILTVGAGLVIDA
jgi:hypothetical protein